MNHTSRTSCRPPSRVRVPVGFAAVLVAVSMLSACGGGSGGGTGAAATSPAGSGTGGASSTVTGSGAASSGAAPVAPAATTTTDTAVATQVRTAVYFLHAGKLSPAPRTVAAPATAAGALRALLGGPNAYERGKSRVTSIPSGTALRSIAVHGRVATVDLSGRYDDGATGGSARTRLAQVVFTVTRFSGIDSVRFALDGKPVTSFGAQHIPLANPVGRAAFESVSPAVLVESPLIGDTVRTPVRVRGTANTFEAVFRLRLTDAAGHVAADVQVHATSGTGTRGTFDVTVPFTITKTGAGTLTAYYVSPNDGSKVTVETVPLTLAR